MNAPGIKLRIKNDVDGEAQHIYLVPSIKSTIVSIATFIIALGVVIALAGGMRDRYRQVPINTKAVMELRKQNIELTVQIKGNSLILKGILMKVDPVGAEALIKQTEIVEALLKQELEKLEMGGMQSK
jgi:hypothetical protein